MHIIPVIDIRDGQVVAAREGRRECYPPLSSRLTEDTDPRAVIDALRTLHAFQTVYVADLDALMGFGAQWSVIRTLAKRYGALTFWVDQGLPADGLPSVGPGNVVPVIGTESLRAADLRRWWNSGTNFILSLDFLGHALLGDTASVQDSTYWPDRVIVMSLAHVGSAKGPDFARLREFRQRDPARQFIAAGGVRDAADLDALAALGMYGVLLASALHSGAITVETLKKYDSGISRLPAGSLPCFQGNDPAGPWPR